MKLYYYILSMDTKSKPIIRTTECEVKEEGGIYRPVEGNLPIGRYAVVPNGIGRLELNSFGYEKAYVVTLEPNLKLAKRLFVEHIDKRIEACKERIAVLEERRNTIEALEQTKEW